MDRKTLTRIGLSALFFVAGCQPISDVSPAVLENKPITLNTGENKFRFMKFSIDQSASTKIEDEQTLQRIIAELASSLNVIGDFEVYVVSKSIAEADFGKIYNNVAPGLLDHLSVNFYFDGLQSGDIGGFYNRDQTGRHKFVVSVDSGQDTEASRVFLQALITELLHSKSNTESYKDDDDRRDIAKAYYIVLGMSNCLHQETVYWESLNIPDLTGKSHNYPFDQKMYDLGCDNSYYLLQSEKLLKVVK